jgi:hypothetical protein
MNKLDIASKLKTAIALYVDATVKEHVTQQIDTDADEAWSDIEKHIEQLTQE